jgi:hypothetical protein
MIDTCIGPCGRENVEIVGHGLCGRCHLQWWRAAKAAQEFDAPGSPKPDKSQKKYQIELSDQRIMMSKVVKALESTPVLETALSRARVAAIIEELNQGIRIVDNAKQFSENPKNKFSENSNDLPHIKDKGHEEFSENQESEFSENSAHDNSEDDEIEEDAEEEDVVRSAVVEIKPKESR